MSKHNIVFIGMDTHKSFIELAYIEDVRGVKPIYLGKSPFTKQVVTKPAHQFEFLSLIHRQKPSRTSFMKPVLAAIGSITGER